MAATVMQETPSGYRWDFWALGRPMTKTWGSGQVWARICQNFGAPDVAFGVVDNIPAGVLTVDREPRASVQCEWAKLPFADNHFAFGYWDPPYDKLYRPECREIWRTVRKLAVLHTHCYPTSWMPNAKRTAGVAITMGPLKQIRFLQIFEKESAGSLSRAEEDRE